MRKLLYYIIFFYLEYYLFIYFIFYLFHFIYHSSFCSFKICNCDLSCDNKTKLNTLHTSSLCIHNQIVNMQHNIHGKWKIHNNTTTFITNNKNNNINNFHNIHNNYININNNNRTSIFIFIKRWSWKIETRRGKKNCNINTWWKT